MKILERKEIAERYSEIVARLEPAFKKDAQFNPRTASDEVFDCISKDGFFILEDGDTIMTAHFEHSALQKVLYISYIVGKLDDIVKNAHKLTELAKFMKCQVIKTSGRKGWKKIFKDWKAETQYSKELI